VEGKKIKKYNHGSSKVIFITFNLKYQFITANLSPIYQLEREKKLSKLTD